MNSFHHTLCRLVVISAVLVSSLAALGIVPWRLVAAEAAEPVADKPSQENGPAKLSPAQEKIFQALHQRVRFKSFRTPLNTVVAFIKDKHEFDLQLDEKALRDAGVKSDAPVILHITLDVPAITLNNALWLMGRELDDRSFSVREDAVQRLAGIGQSIALTQGALKDSDVVQCCLLLTKT